jgi:hypothetical protein
MGNVERTEQHIDQLIFFVKWTGVTAFLLLLCLLLLFYFSGYKHAELLGQFGDFIGGVLNPCYSLISLFAILVSLIYSHFNYEFTMAANTVAMDAVKIQLQQVKFDYEKSQLDRIDNEIKSRRDLTISWHQNWMSPQLSTLKREVYEEITERISNMTSGEKTTFLGPYRQSEDFNNRAKYLAIKDVIRLIQHTITLFENDLVDKDLFLKIFKKDLSEWHAVFSMLDMREDSDDSSRVSLSDEAERQDMINRLARAIDGDAVQ